MPTTAAPFPFLSLRHYPLRYFPSLGRIFNRFLCSSLRDSFILLQRCNGTVKRRLKEKKKTFSHIYKGTFRGNLPLWHFRSCTRNTCIYTYIPAVTNSSLRFFQSDTHLFLFLSLSLSPSHSLSLSLSLSHFSIKANKLLFLLFLFFFPPFSIIESYTIYRTSFRFTICRFFFARGCTTLTITESKGLWQARAAAAADERTSRDSRAFSLGYHPVPKPPRSARPWKAGRRQGCWKSEEEVCVYSLVHRRKGQRVGVDTALAGV